MRIWSVYVALLTILHEKNVGYNKLQNDFYFMLRKKKWPVASFLLGGGGGGHLFHRSTTWGRKVPEQGEGVSPLPHNFYTKNWAIWCIPEVKLLQICGLGGCKPPEPPPPHSPRVWEHCVLWGTAIATSPWRMLCYVTSKQAWNMRVHLGHTASSKYESLHIIAWHQIISSKGRATFRIIIKSFPSYSNSFFFFDLNYA